MTIELLYLKQAEYIKDKLLKEFPDLNTDYADSLVDDYYNELYGEEE